MIETNINEKLVKRHECAYLLTEKRFSDDEAWSDYSQKKFYINETIKAANISHYGEAIVYIEYVEDGDFWVAHCDEYATVIKYCPFCGIELERGNK